MSAVEIFGGVAVEQVRAGVQRFYVHRDLEVLESNRQNQIIDGFEGNTDPRFPNRENPGSDQFDIVRLNRGIMTGHSGCERMVVMVPQISDGFISIDRPFTASKEGYKNWPPAFQPEEDVYYDPDDAPAMIDLPTDGLITARPRQALMLNTADCAPVILYDKALALAHIGREGAARDIGQKMLASLTRESGSRPEDVRVHIGSAIAAGSYILDTVGEALRQPAWEQFLRKVPGGYETDFVGYAINRLLQAGVKGENITRSPVDVATNVDYFSLTRSKDWGVPDQGRNGFLAMIK